MKASALQAYARRLTRIAAQRWAPTLVFVALVIVVDATRSWSIGGGWFDIFPSGGVLRVILGCSAAAVGSALAAALPWSGWRLTVASVVITLTFVGGSLLLAYLLAPYAAINGDFILSDTAFTLRSFWSLSTSGLLFSLYCSAREREAEMLAAARNAELERAGAQRALLDSRLQVLQAQIDPALLFEGLADVHRLYVKDVDAAAMRLDELIAYLRAALPRIRS